MSLWHQSLNSANARAQGVVLLLIISDAGHGGRATRYGLLRVVVAALTLFLLLTVFEEVLVYLDLISFLTNFDEGTNED